MKTALSRVHFTDTYLLHPTNPILVNLIGAGGTGSQVLTALARMHQSLIALEHPGLSVWVFDDDVVTTANLGRQLFSRSELGMNKGVALINRINRFFGTNWKAVPERYAKTETAKAVQNIANITISCVDTVQARFEIAEIISIDNKKYEDRNNPIYWMDFGNSQYTGQVLLSTVREIQQPQSKKHIPVGSLPFVTEEYKELLAEGADSDTPSCSLAEALTKQDLFINSTLAHMGASLLWQMFREGMIANRGFFLNLKEFRTLPVKV